MPEVYTTYTPTKRCVSCSEGVMTCIPTSRCIGDLDTWSDLIGLYLATTMQGTSTSMHKPSIILGDIYYWLPYFEEIYTVHKFYGKIMQASQR